MKLLSLDNLKSFYEYIQRSFVSPYAKRDEAGNIIKDTYVKKDDVGILVKQYATTPDNAKHAYEADRADEADSSNNAKHANEADFSSNAAHADAAQKLEIERTISLEGPVTGQTSFDGSKDASIKTEVPQLDALSKFLFRQPSASYASGDVVYVKGSSAKYRLSCITAGTTGAEELSTALTAGLYITDGTVTWIIEDTTQGDSVGDITLHPTLLAGHVLANGATVKASEYPRLLAWVQENSMTGADDAHYTYDESADTLKLPNASDRFLQAGSAVAVKTAGLPNIAGTIEQGDYWNAPNCQGSGAFTAMQKGWTSWNRNTPVTTAPGGFSFDASRSSAIYGASATVQPPAITLLAQIKY